MTTMARAEQLVFPVAIRSRFTLFSSMSIRYVDSSVATSGNGQSWASAWKAIANISGLGAGDIVYFSGGAQGGSGKSYTVPGSGWTPLAGTAAKRITYQIGQDAGHNGIASFSGSGPFLTGNLSGVTVSGDAGDGKQHFQVGSVGSGVINANNANGFTVSYVNFGRQSNGLIGGNPCQNLQIDHCFFYKLTSSSA